MDRNFIMSPLQNQRLSYLPKLPALLSHLRQVGIAYQPCDPSKVQPSILEKFPHTACQPSIAFKHVSGLPPHTPKRVGVVFSGGQASGGHNVIVGLFDALLTLHPDSRLFGFVGGPSGIINNSYIEITRDLAHRYRNMGGFDMIGSGRTKIDTPEQFEAAAKTADALRLDAFVIIGGDDSNTNAALLAEYFKGKGLQISVIGVPKTIDGDLKNCDIEISFGFDTACKTYSDIIGNIARDALSAKKYYHFIKLMGRSASHIALECALQTHPNLTLIGEEVTYTRKTLRDLTVEISDLICKRADKGMHYGVILLPEGIIEFIPEFRKLISELNVLLAPNAVHSTELAKWTSPEERLAYIKKILTLESFACFSSIPALIQDQLLTDRDPHGNVHVSGIETEKLFISTVSEELAARKRAGTYKGKFSPQAHFLGYEGRSCFPSNFDAQYCYVLGHAAALLIQNNVTGYMCTIGNLTAPVEEWECGGTPLAGMLIMEERHGKPVPVIKKALVDLRGAPYKAFQDLSPDWQLEDKYRFPGPIQFTGHHDVTDALTYTLLLETNAVGIYETV